MITLENWAYIRRQVAEGVPKKAIAEELGISRTNFFSWKHSFGELQVAVQVGKRFMSTE